MHKLAKGLKKKKKQKRGKKEEAEDEFDPVELERYRRERAVAQEKLSEQRSETLIASSNSEEWKKFVALTAGVDSILKKSQGDLDRIKSNSFFQRKAPSQEKPFVTEITTVDNKSQSRRWVGFDKGGSCIARHQEDNVLDRINTICGNGIFNVQEDENGQEISTEDDIFDTTYVDVIQNIDIKLAYIPDSPIEEKEVDDPFDTTNAAKVLKTIDKKGKKLVSIGNAVEVLAGRINHVSSCKIRTTEPIRVHDLLLDNDGVSEVSKTFNNVTSSVNINQTLLDEDLDFPDVPVDSRILPSIAPAVTSTAKKIDDHSKNKSEVFLEISEFEFFKKRTFLEEIPDLDDSELDSNTFTSGAIIIPETENPFSTEKVRTSELQNKNVEENFETATLSVKDEPFNTVFADHITPGKKELEFIKEGSEEVHKPIVSISLIDQAGLNEADNTEFTKNRVHKISNCSSSLVKNNFLDDIFNLNDVSRSEIPEISLSKVVSFESPILSSQSSQSDQSSKGKEENVFPREFPNEIDPFDTSFVIKVSPSKTELRLIESDLLEAEIEKATYTPIEAEISTKEDHCENSHVKEKSKGNKSTIKKEESILDTVTEVGRRPLMPRVETKLIKEDNISYADPFDTSIATNILPGKVELKLLETELGQVSEHTQVRSISINLEELTSTSIRHANKVIPTTYQEEVSKDFLFSSGDDPGCKILTPLQNKALFVEEVDPFDTSFATVKLGKTELKLLESELIEKNVPQINLVDIK